MMNLKNYQKAKIYLRMMQKKKEKIIQEYTDDQIKIVDERVSTKEKEIMTI